MKIIEKLIVIAVLFLSTSCATLFTGSKQSVQINSNVQGARIQVNGVDKGVTPATIKLKKGKDGQVISLANYGYETKILQPETGMNLISIINLFNIFGWGIDAVSGALWKYDQKQYMIEMEPRDLVENR
ncbi:PEGA domain-containing protein [Aquiflexum balticum DSM 16537]|uniref:PEGA domain-containing protein n=1 Tax=Aquiflexum balticum DSM 16537 TaxID=758820 RepID=A0A1W2H5A2_9BACT|nr:PEGA domain-containing protein [Aquiflexum balticum]SMD44130.1 PEGA domain-containing protein [Aquiflexum balticum DSM 16537]